MRHKLYKKNVIDVKNINTFVAQIRSHATHRLSHQKFCCKCHATHKILCVCIRKKTLKHVGNNL